MTSSQRAEFDRQAIERSRRQNRDENRSNWASQVGQSASGLRFKTSVVLSRAQGILGKYTPEAQSEIKRKREVSPDDLKSYESFLKDKKTGIFRLFPDANCIRDMYVAIDGDCKNYVIESSAYSFRWKTYDHAWSADLYFSNGRFITRGLFSTGLIASIGDVSLESLKNSDQTVVQLNKWQTPETVASAKSENVRIDKGIEIGGVKFTSEAPIEPGMTYLLRVIAYRPDLQDRDRGRPFTNRTELQIASLYNDIRDDLTVAFRVIKRSDDGGLTILYRELNSERSPKLKIAKDAPVTDLR